MSKLITVYCDGSFRNGVGTGGAYIRTEGKLFTTSFTPFESLESTHAELLTILKSLEFVIVNFKNLQESTILFVSDSKGALLVLWPWNREKVNDKYRDVVKRIYYLQEEYKFNIRTKWVKGHQKTPSIQQYCNNYVDQLASNAQKCVL